MALCVRDLIKFLEQIDPNNTVLIEREGIWAPVEILETNPDRIGLLPAEQPTQNKNTIFLTTSRKHLGIQTFGQQSPIT